MKYLLSLMLIATPFMLTQAEETSPACAYKQAHLQDEIEAAKTAKDFRKVAGLEKALKISKRSCTDEALEDQRLARIEKSKREVAEREQELLDAEKKGDRKKILKKQQKLQQAIVDLKEAEKPLAR